MKNESVYIVWCPSGSNPTKRHTSQAEAISEAKRLAGIEHDKEFFVLRAVKSIKYRTEPFEVKNYSKKG